MIAGPRQPIVAPADLIRFVAFGMVPLLFPKSLARDVPPWSFALTPTWSTEQLVFILERSKPTMTTLKSPLTRVEWGFGLRWVLATTVGWVVGFAICEAFEAFLGPFTVVEGAVIGISVGIGQWLVLKGRINRAGWWILASIIGFAVGKAVGDAFAHVSGAVGMGLTGAAIGASVGIAQWFVLRRHVVRAEWWVLASVLAWAVGGGIIRGEEAGGWPTETAYVIGAAGAAVAGAMTGASLVWLLRLRRA